MSDLVGAEGSTAAPSAAGATGTSGRNAVALDEATKDKLRDVRKEITAMAAGMSGSAASAATAPAAATASSPDTTAASTASTPATASSQAATEPATPAASTAAATQTPSSPATQTPSAAPQAEQTPASPQAGQPSAAPAGQVDRDAAKQHLSEARESLSQLAALPEAAKLQGETRTLVSQLISNFNELITTQADWKAAYQKVENSLNTLLGAEASEAAAAPAAQPTGTAWTPSAAGAAAAGTTGSSAGLDPAIRAKLVEFSTHLK